jgi:hypothetical protein
LQGVLLLAALVMGRLPNSAVRLALADELRRVPPHTHPERPAKGLTACCRPALVPDQLTQPGDAPCPLLHGLRMRRVC